MAFKGFKEFGRREIQKILKLNISYWRKFWRAAAFLFQTPQVKKVICFSPVLDCGYGKYN